MANVRWSKTALASLTAQDDYLRAINPNAANNVLNDIEASVGLLADFPLIGRRIENTGLRFHVSQRYRYRIIYRAGEDLQIMDVLHPRQNPNT